MIQSGSWDTWNKSLHHRVNHALNIFYSSRPYHFVVDLMEVDLTHFLNHIFILKGNKTKTWKRARKKKKLLKKPL